MSETQTYSVVAICDNCRHTPKEIDSDGRVIQPLRYVIPKGTRTDEFLYHQVCPNCDCKRTLRFRY